MTRPKRAADKVAIEILRDGVFVAADVRKDKGERAEVSPEIAQPLIERGFARVV